MRKLTFSGLVAAAVLAVASPAGAHGGPPETFTDNVHGVTETSGSVNPCTLDPGVLTITYNAVFHVTIFPDGHIHVTGTQTGTFSFDTDDPALPDFSGHFTSWFGFSNNPNTTTGSFTFNIHGKGTDGSRLTLHETEHVTIVGTDVIVEFDKLRCG